MVAVTREEAAAVSYSPTYLPRLIPAQVNERAGVGESAWGEHVE